MTTQSAKAPTIPSTIPPIPHRNSQESDVTRIAPSGLPGQCEPCDDGFYVVQPLWSDGTLCGSETRYDSEAAAIKAAADERHCAWFEGSAVRVITADGEMVVEFEVAS